MALVVAAAPDAELRVLMVEVRQVMHVEFAALHTMAGPDQVRIEATPGGPLEALDRSLSVCERVLSLPPVPDAFVTVGPGGDSVLAGSPWVTGAEPFVRHYAAVPLIGLAAWIRRVKFHTSQGYHLRLWCRRACLYLRHAP